MIISGDAVQKCMLGSEKLVIALTLTEHVVGLLEQPLELLWGQDNMMSRENIRKDISPSFS